MGKFYVTAHMKNPDQTFRHVLNAATPQEAAALVWMRLRLPIYDSNWECSEQGFGGHTDDLIRLTALDVAKKLSKIKKSRPPY